MLLSQVTYLFHLFSYIALMPPVPPGILSVMKTEQLNRQMQEFRDMVRVRTPRIPLTGTLLFPLPRLLSPVPFRLNIPLPLFRSWLTPLECHSKDGTGDEMATTGGARRREATGRSAIKTFHDAKSPNTNSVVNLCCVVYAHPLPVRFWSMHVYVQRVT